MEKIYLFPGKIGAAKDATEFSTLLGSCVAVALFDPFSKVGGLNHYLLPETFKGESPNGRYGSYAIPQLINEMEALGAKRNRMQAKIYGGASVITAGEGVQDYLSVGARNIEMAVKLLGEFSIPILEKKIGGEKGCRVSLNSNTFEVVHQLNRESASESDSDVSGFKKVLAPKNIKVLIVDDSATVRTLFSNIFSKAGLEVVGAAVDPYEAREMLVTKKPDVMTLDIEMPKMNGVDFLGKIMNHHPIPVVMVSSLGSNGEAALKSLELGAVEFIHKPSQFDPMVLRQLAEQLIEKVKAAASVNVLKQRSKSNVLGINSVSTVSSKVKSAKVSSHKELSLITLGGNSGSANSIGDLLSQLPADTPPVVVACSTIGNFLVSYLMKWKSKCKMDLVQANDGDFLKMGIVYFLPAGKQGTINSYAGRLQLKLESSAPVNSQLPSSSVLFQSAAAVAGAGVYSVLMSGFGIDGVDGLNAVQSKGGFTVVQSPQETDFPFGPQKAIEKGFAEEVLNTQEMAPHLMNYRNLKVAG
jgi:two-component system chemotaxis response regulator CheB